MLQACLGGSTAREEQHHITGPDKLLSRELLQQFVCSYTQMSYGHSKGGEAGNARHESCSVRSYHQDRLTLEEVTVRPYLMRKLGEETNQGPLCDLSANEVNRCNGHRGINMD